MTYPTQSQQPSAAPGRIDVDSSDVTDASLPEQPNPSDPEQHDEPQDTGAQSQTERDRPAFPDETDSAASTATDPMPSWAANQQSTQEPAHRPSDGQLPPGASADDPVAALWGTDLVQRYRDQWQQLQLRFVDDPHGATDEAAQLLDDAVHSLTTTLAEQKQALDGWQSAQSDDTEQLRTALTRYRDFLDRLLGL